MYAIATFLIVALLSMLFTRLSTGALVATGMPAEMAAFQARSAFTGAGFTTTEAENVVNHPARRRVISTTMFVGNLGVPTLVVTVLLGLLAPGPGQTSTRLLVMVAGLSVVVVLAFSPPVTRYFVDLGRRASQPLIQRAVADSYEPLLALGPDVRVVALTLVDDVPLRSVRGLQQAMPAVRVLGVRPGGRSGEFVTGPPSDVELHAGDQVVVMGHQRELDRLLDEGPVTAEPDSVDPA